MRLTLGILLATVTLLVAAGCGEDSPGSGTSQPTEPSRQPSGSQSGKPEGETDVVAILTATAVGGQSSKAAVDVTTPAGVNRLVAGLRSDSLGDQVRAKVAATEIADGRRLLGAIVSVGCDIPTGVSVTGGAGGVHLRPVFTGDRLPECLVAVTSIALVLVEA